MKEIKFRAWDSETETFIYSDKEYDEAWFSFQDGILRAYAIHGMDAGSLDEPPQPNCEKLEKPQQFTGLHDKNGKEIYEGDVYRYTIPEDESIKERRICQVVWNEDGWKGLIKGTSRICFIQNKYIEIIGNIYENPELLKAHNGDKT